MRACPMATTWSAAATTATTSAAASKRSSRSASRNGLVSRGHEARGWAMIDSHHHFWWTKRHAYHWPEMVGDRFNRDFTPDDLRPELARFGIKGTVLVQVLHEVEGETAECLDLSREVSFVRSEERRVGQEGRSG